MLTYYGIPLALKAINQQWGTGLNINVIPAALFTRPLLLMRRLMVKRSSCGHPFSVNPGEIEAVRSLGMTRAQVYRRDYSPNAAGSDTDF